MGLSIYLFYLIYRRCLISKRGMSSSEFDIPLAVHYKRALSPGQAWDILYVVISTFLDSNGFNELLDTKFTNNLGLLFFESSNILSFNAGIVFSNSIS